jgi:hypothetical protein
LDRQARGSLVWLELETQENSEGLLGREGDPMFVPGVPTDVGHLLHLGRPLDAVAAVTADGLVVGHGAADTASCRQDIGKRTSSVGQGADSR